MLPEETSDYNATGDEKNFTKQVNERIHIQVNQNEWIHIQVNQNEWIHIQVNKNN